MNRFTNQTFKIPKCSNPLGILVLFTILLSTHFAQAQTANCGDLAALTSSNFPGATVTSGTGGACLLCGVTDDGNVVNSNTEDYAKVALNISVGGSAYVQVNSPVIFPAGTEAGMSFNPQEGFIGVVGLDILGKITVSTYLNGQLQETQGGDNLINGDILGFFNNKQSRGFTTNLPFNQIRITFNTGLGLLSNPVVYHAYVRTGCFNFQSCPSAATVSTGSFIANGTAGQNGTLSIPITNATAGPVNVTVSGSGFSVNPNPKNITVTSGQTDLLVPVVFNGSGTPGTRTVNISVTTSAGTKTCTVTVPVLPASVLSITNEAMNLNLNNQPEYTGSAYTEGIPTGGVEIPGNSGKYNYYAVNCVTGTSTAGTATSTTSVLTSIAGINPVTGASYAVNLYPNVHGTVVINRTTGAYTYTSDAAYTGTTAKFCVKVCDLDEISPCKQIEYNLNNIKTAANSTVNPPTVSTNPNPPVAGQSATFTASGCTGTVTWYNNGSQVGTGSPFTVTNVPANSSYTSTCTVNGVTSQPSTPIVSTNPTVTNPPTISSNPNPLVVGQPAVLTASGCAGTVTWYVNGSLAGVQGNTYNVPSVSSGAIYTATCTVNGVASQPSQPITAPTAVNAPTITSNPNPPVVGNAAQLNANGCAGTVSWYNNGTFVGSGTPFTVTNVPANASYTATCSVNGVTSPASQPITTGAGTVNPPSISSSPNPPVAGQSVTLSANGCAGTVTWLNNGSQVGTGTPFTTTAVAGANYTATCTVNGTVSSPSTSITVPNNEQDYNTAIGVNSPGQFTLNASKTYTITFTNTRNTTATQPVQALISAPFGWSCSGCGNVTIPVLNAGQTHTVNVSLTANNAGATGTLSSSITNGSGGDNRSDNNTSTVSLRTAN